MRRSRSEERPVKDLWRALVMADLELVWKVQGAVRAWPIWMQYNLARLVSHHPLKDVSIITWFGFLLGCHRFGFHFFWASCSNLVVATFLRLLLSAPRPFMYDQRLRPLADRYETSHGLPSLETHMATVVAGWWAESGGGYDETQADADVGVRPIVRLIAFGYICFVGFSRVYACSRFVHQVALSVLTGLVGLHWGWKLSTHLDGLRLMVKHHLRGTVVVVVIALGIIAYHVENNDSQLMGIKKQEYLRVLSHIIAQSERTQGATIGEAEIDETIDADTTRQDDFTRERRTSLSRKRHVRLEKRRDSFHFLQKSIERRAAERAAVVRLGVSKVRDTPRTARGISGKDRRFVGAASSGGKRREWSHQPTESRLGGGPGYVPVTDRAWRSPLR